MIKIPMPLIHCFQLRPSQTMSLSHLHSYLHFSLFAGFQCSLLSVFLWFDILLRCLLSRFLGWPLILCHVRVSTRRPSSLSLCSWCGWFSWQAFSDSFPTSSRCLEIASTSAASYVGSSGHCMSLNVCCTRNCCSNSRRKSKKQTSRSRILAFMHAIMYAPSEPVRSMTRRA